jgi:DNA polymerase (family 10)
MNKNDVAAVLDEIGTLLEVQGENQFRCIAYHNAARAIANLEGDLAEFIKSGELASIKGIGEAMVEKITTLMSTGHLPYYEDLKKKIPDGVIDMLRIPGMGPKKVKLLYDELKIDTVERLKAACENDEIAHLKGFGQKTQQKILEGIQFLGTVGNRVRIDEAMFMADILLEDLRKCPGIIRLEVGGSIRRRRETAKDIDLLASAKDPAKVMDTFVKLPNVMQVIAHGPTKSSIVVSAAMGKDRIVMNADLRVVDDKQFPFALHYFTGSKDHNIAIRQRAIDRGLKLNEYELAGDGKSVHCKDEADVFKALDLEYIPPELRENTGEIDAAEKHKLPDLIQVDDITGVFHNHTSPPDGSDGRDSLEEMAEAARALGFKYLGIADHSQSLTIANGLTPRRVREQHQRIDALNKKFKEFKLLKGTECDILPDGSLDFSDDVLATFDYVVASVHTHFNQSEQDMTRRIVKAVSNPHVTMLGHATGRLLLRREGYHVNLEEVLKAAAKHGTMIEINAQPLRLDLDWVHCKRARALGVKLVINPDAHSTGELALYRYGVYVAQRGWLEKSDVFNTGTLAQVTKGLKKK